MTERSRLSIGLIGLLIAFESGVYLQRAAPVSMGFTLFLAGPLILGYIGAWTFRPKSPSDGAYLGLFTALAANGAFLALRFEGAICIIMACPLTLSLGALGGYCCYEAQAAQKQGRSAALLLLLPPLSLTWDANMPSPVYEVRTSIDVAARPEQVWKHVVTFSELPAPTEWIFHTGIAYPIRARIEGSGAGAIRYCEFSTGPFVEPIEIWNEPRLLKFRVTHNPPPLAERNPFGPVQSQHLRGYLVSHRGQFALIGLPNGHTRLEGTTWYSHGLWPAAYWRWWSDTIIHRIHLRVLNHVRALSERQS